MIYGGTFKNELQQTFCKVVAENNGRIKIFLKELLQHTNVKRANDFNADQLETRPEIWLLT